MTVENVLERTVVHDVEPNGPAVAAGVSSHQAKDLTSAYACKNKSSYNPLLPHPPAIFMRSRKRRLCDNKLIICLQGLQGRASCCYWFRKRRQPNSR